MKTTYLLLACVVGLLLAPACAARSATPATIAHYATGVLQEVKIAQEGVITLNAAKVIPDDTTRKILDGIVKVVEEAGKLDRALRLYDAALPQERPKSLADVSELLNHVNTLVAQAFDVALPANAVSQVQQLIANVDKTILDIQLELAKGK